MTELASGRTVVDAWRAAAQRVLDRATYRIPNLVTDITEPTVFDRAWLTTYDPLAVGAKDRLSPVVKVLFPYAGRRPGETRAQFYERWNRALRRNRDLGFLVAKWGTYFERLTTFAGETNQLENIITALATWKLKPAAALVAHLSSPSLDAIQPMGSPCLQFIEVLRRDDQIDLVAVYRNHDFLNKALGNYIGLGRLLHFIATESGIAPGTLTCHSVHAYCNSPTKLRQLMAR